MILKFVTKSTLTYLIDICSTFVRSSQTIFTLGQHQQNISVSIYRYIRIIIMSSSIRMSHQFLPTSATSLSFEHILKESGIQTSILLIINFNKRHFIFIT